MVSTVDTPTESGTLQFRRARATGTLRRGRTKRGFWITVTAEDQDVISTIERTVLQTGLLLHSAKHGEPGKVTTQLGTSQPGDAVAMGARPMRWSYAWADLLAREEGDGAYHVYRRRAGHGSGDGLQQEELMVTPSREHALLEMGALLEGNSRPSRTQGSSGRPNQGALPRGAPRRKAA